MKAHTIRWFLEVQRLHHIDPYYEIIVCLSDKIRVYVCSYASCACLPDKISLVYQTNCLSHKNKIYCN